MGWLEAVVMGIIQGLTEFLPISSTAHLFVIPQLLGWGDRGSTFTAVIQLGTLVAVMLYFRGDIARLIAGFWGDVKALRPCSNPDGTQAWMIVVGTLPVVACAIAFKPYIKGELRNLYVVAGAALAFAVLLAIAEIVAKRRPGRETFGWGDALLMGSFQAFALIPGASRSGTTITAGLLGGLSRGASARFSFLLSLPAVFAAGVKELYDDRATLLASNDDIVALVIATVVSGVVGYASIAWLLRFLKTSTTWPFIIYRVLLGVTLFALLANGVIQPKLP